LGQYNDIDAIPALISAMGGEYVRVAHLFNPATVTTVSDFLGLVEENFGALNPREAKRNLEAIAMRPKESAPEFLKRAAQLAADATTVSEENAVDTAINRLPHPVAVWMNTRGDPPTTFQQAIKKAFDFENVQIMGVPDKVAKSQEKKAHLVDVAAVETSSSEGQLNAVLRELQKVQNELATLRRGNGPRQNDRPNQWRSQNNQRPTQPQGGQGRMRRPPSWPQPQARGQAQGRACDNKNEQNASAFQGHSFQCGGYGHMKRDCTNPPQQPPIPSYYMQPYPQPYPYPPPGWPQVPPTGGKGRAKDANCVQVDDPEINEGIEGDDDLAGFQ
jgi:hypothetical protein